jgi:hypothetical protein
MAKQLLRDRTGRILGWYDDGTAGKIYLRDWMGRICGWYEPKTNYTRDKQGRIVGRGNLLTTLLPPRT